MQRLRERVVDSGYALLALFIGEELVEPQSTDDRWSDSVADYHRRFWIGWDRVCRALLRIRPLTAGESELFAICKRRYWGRPLSICGTVVRRFDPIVEIHLNNALLSRTLERRSSVVGAGTRLLREARQSFAALAECLRSPEYDNVHVVYAVTLAHRGLERLGFEVSPIENRAASRFLQWYLGHLLKAVNPDGRRLLQQRPEAFVPKRAAMSKARFLELYGTTES